MALGRVVDALSDWGVLVYGLWTLIAWCGMLTRAPVSVLVPVWFAAGAVSVIAVRLLGSRSGEVESVASTEPLTRKLAPLAVGLGGSAVAGLVAALGHDSLWPLGWLGAAAAVGAALSMGGIRSSGSGGEPGRRDWWADGIAAVVGLGLAGMSLFLNRPNLDDVFYVNRATATAQLNRIPVRDVIFTHEQVDPTSGAGLPVDSFSALEGAIARLVGVEAASVAYYVVPPLMTFFAIWALWRLVRAWAPRNLVLCFLVGCAYWVFSAQVQLAPGSFFLTRMWQGKVIFAAWLVPTLYVLLTRWLDRRDRTTGLLLLAAGISAVGMTGSASFVAPLIFASAILVALARREWRALPVPALAGLIPLAIGFAVTREYPIAERLGGNVHEPGWYLRHVFGTGVVAGLAVFAVWIAPVIARPGTPRRLTMGVGVVALVLLAPGVLRVIGDAAGLSTALRRTLLTLPMPALVGLLAAAPLELGLVRRVWRGVRVRRAVGLAPALLACALLVGFGHPLWSTVDGRSLWTTRPSWKVDPRALADARAILQRYRGTGAILVDAPVMAAISLVTVDPKAVNARRWYAILTPEPGKRTAEREALTRFVAGETAIPRRRLAKALTNLDVGLVCAPRARSRVLAAAEGTGLFSQQFAVGRFRCLER